MPAVYFVSPTLTNIKRIAQDLEKGLYESFHFNFVEPLPRALLEELAAAVARDGTGELVEQVSPASPTRTSVHVNTSQSMQVLDQYLSFIAPSPSLFSLLPPPAAPSASTPNAPAQPGPSQTHSTYAILNSPTSAEQQIEEEIERVANGLFSVVATMSTCLFPLAPHASKVSPGHVPIIRSPRGNAAEMIAKKLETKIRDAILSAARSHTTSIFAQDSSGLSNLQRPRMFSDP